MKFDRYYIVWAIPIVYSLVIITLSTKWGIGLMPDSVQYITGARKLLDGGGISKLGTHYPPLYYYFIAVFGLFSESILDSLRVLHIAIYVMTILTIGILTYRMTDRSHFYSIGAMLSVALSASMLQIFVVALSEPLFLYFSLVGIYFLSVFFEKNEIGYLVVASMLFGLSFLTRYASAPLVLTALLMIASCKSLIGRRVQSICLLFIFSVVPVVSWAMVNYSIGVSIDRQIKFHPVGYVHWKQFSQTICKWFSYSNDFCFESVVFVLVIYLIYFLCKNRLDSGHAKNISSQSFVNFSLLFAPIYICFLVFSISLFDAHTPLDNRLLSPVYLFLLLSLILLARKTQVLVSGRYSKLFVFFVFIFLFSGFSKAGNQMEEYIKSGIGYASPNVVTSGIVKCLRDLNKNKIIYTNAPDLITLYLNRDSYMLPRMINPANMRESAKFVSEINEMADSVRGQQGVIVYFFDIKWRWYLPKVSFLMEELPVKLLYKANDGIVLTI